MRHCPLCDLWEQSACTLVHGESLYVLSLQNPLQRYRLYEHCVSCLISSSHSTGPCMVDEEKVH